MYDRHRRACCSSSSIWGLALTAGSLRYLPTGIGAVICRSSLKNWMTTTEFFLIISELIAPLWPQDEEGHMPEGIFPPTPPATPPTSADEAVSSNPRGEGGHRQITGSSHVCQTCNKSYTSRAKLNEHVNFRHSEARPYRCLQCPKVFKSASNLKAHFKRTHERLRFTCPDCPLGLGKW